MEARPRWSRNDEPPAPGPVLNVTRVGATDSFTVVVLSHKWSGFNLHWNPVNKRHIFCTIGDPAGECEGHDKKMPFDWSCFLHVTGRDLVGNEALQLTEHGCNQLKKLLTLHGTLRGMILHVARTRKTLRSPVGITLIGVMEGLDGLPKERKLDATAERLYCGRSLPLPENGSQVE
jgi:hypothetical protein